MKVDDSASLDDVKKLAEVGTIDDANQHVAAGWSLLSVYQSPDDGRNRYVLGWRESVAQEEVEPADLEELPPSDRDWLFDEPETAIQTELDPADLAEISPKLSALFFPETSTTIVSEETKQKLLAMKAAALALKVAKIPGAESDDEGPTFQ